MNEQSASASTTSASSSSSSSSSTLPPFPSSSPPPKRHKSSLTPHQLQRANELDERWDPALIQQIKFNIELVAKKGRANPVREKVRKCAHQCCSITLHGISEYQVHLDRQHTKCDKQNCRMKEGRLTQQIVDDMNKEFDQQQKDREAITSLPSPSSIAQSSSDSSNSSSHSIPPSASFTTTSLFSSDPPFNTHGWKLFHPNNMMHALASQWAVYYEKKLSTRVENLSELADEYEDCGEWTGIRGDMQQLNLLVPQVHDTELSILQSLTEAVCMDYFDQVGLHVGKKQLLSLKVVRAKPGKGLQPAHCDNKDANANVYSLLITIYPTHHTAMPLLSIEETLPVDPSSLSADKFISRRVESGTTVLFRGNVVHYGVRNMDSFRDRVLVFLMFTDAATPPAEKDAVQLFPLGQKKMHPKGKVQE